MEAIQIKEIPPGNFKDIIKVIEITWEPTYRNIITSEQIVFMQQEIYSPDSLRKQYEAGQRFIGLYENSTVIGFASYSLLSGDSYKLNKLYVHPNTQRKGFGQLLIRQIEQEVKKNGGTQLLLNVNKFNPALNFYIKQGFSLIREENIPIGPYFMNDFVLKKKLF